MFGRPNTRDMNRIGSGRLVAALASSLMVAVLLMGNVAIAAPTLDEPCSFCAANTARWNGLAAEYAKANASIAAQAARYTALAEKTAAASAASAATYAGRYAGLAGAFRAARSASIEASAARWSGNAAELALAADRTNAASAARLVELPAWYGGVLDQGNLAYAARLEALAETVTPDIALCLGGK